jgi:methionyl-tRNA formyltransferase
LLRVVFFGTPHFAEKILGAVLASNVEVVSVITNPDRPVGRSGKAVPSPVKRYALERGLSVYQPEKASHPDFAEQLKAFQADLFVVAAYGEILKPHVLETPKIGCINIHASLLPKFRGAAPIQRCIMEGEVESGVTIMEMETKMDAGGIIKVVKTPIAPDMNSGELFDVLADLGGKAIQEVLEQCSHEGIVAQSQPQEGITMAPKIKPEESLIDWSQSSKIHYNQFRGLSPKPGVYTHVEIQGKQKRLLIKQMRPVSGDGKRGNLLADQKDRIQICCEQGGAIELLEVQLEGKKQMPASEFLRGFPLYCLKF